MAPAAPPWLRRHLPWAISAVVAGIGVGVAVRAIGIPRRWEWWLWSPNDLGALSAAALALLASLAPCWLGGDARVFRWPLILCAVVGLALLAGLVGSCSRGGACAALAGLSLVAAVRQGRARWPALALLGAALVAIAIVPRIHDRLLILDAQGLDRSIANRLDIWTATLAMVADRPGGWGAGRFEGILNAWYLPRFLGQPITQPYGDALLIAAERGVAVAWLFVAAGAGAVIGLVQRARSGAPCCAGLAGAALALLVAGSSTSLLRPYGIGWYALAVAGVAAIALAWPGWPRRALGLAALIGSGLATLLVVPAWRHGATVAERLPWMARSETSAWTRSGQPVAAVMVVRSSADGDGDICRQVLRALLTAGCDARVVAADGQLDPGEPGPRSLPVVLALRGAGPAVVAQLCAGTLRPQPRAAVLLDWNGEGATGDLPVPVLALYGSALPPTASPAASIRSGLTSRLVAVPICWPRRFPALVDGIVWWIRSLSSSHAPGVSANDGQVALPATPAGARLLSPSIAHDRKSRALSG